MKQIRFKILDLLNVDSLTLQQMIVPLTDNTEQRLILAKTANWEYTFTLDLCGVEMTVTTPYNTQSRSYWKLGELIAADVPHVIETI